MSQTGKYILGALTILPMLLFTGYMAWFMQFFVNMMEQAPLGHTPKAAKIFDEIIWVAIWALLFGALQLGLTIYYIVHAAKNKSWEPGSSMKAIWIVVIIFGGVIGMIAYFFVEIWPKKTPPPVPH